jgi:hypothetical protein
MSGEPDVTADNTRERDRLRALVDRLTDGDLTRRVGSRGSVAASLAHLAFWDLCALGRLERWERGGVAPSPVDVDVINDALRDVAEALHPRTAARLAVASAEAVDRKVEGLSAELVQAIEAAGLGRNLRRSLHRRHHLEAIERALEQGPAEARRRP